jgi:hypothetical protein
MTKITKTRKPVTLEAAAKKLLNLFGPKGQHWIKGVSAVDSKGDTVAVQSKKAVKWCFSGAIIKLNLPQEVRSAFRETIGGSIIDFNDGHRTYTHVRKLLERVAKPKTKK